MANVIIVILKKIQVSDPVDKSEQHHGLDIWHRRDNHGPAYHV